MSYILAKENPKNPEGWTYLRKYEYDHEKDIHQFSMTMFKTEAYEFDSKSEAAQVYWIANHNFYGYKIYNK